MASSSSSSCAGSSSSSSDLVLRPGAKAASQNAPLQQQQQQQQQAPAVSSASDAPAPQAAHAAVTPAEQQPQPQLQQQQEAPAAVEQQQQQHAPANPHAHVPADHHPASTDNPAPANNPNPTADQETETAGTMRTTQSELSATTSHTAAMPGDDATSADDGEAGAAASTATLSTAPSASRLARVVGSSRVASAAVTTEQATAESGLTTTASTSSLAGGSTADTVILHVVTVDGDKKALRLPADVTIAGIKEEFARKIGLVHSVLFELCISTSDGEQFLDSALPLTAVSLPADRTLYLKVKYWKEPRAFNDSVAITKVYRQIQRNIVNGSWQAPEAFAMRLASYHVRAAFGEFQSRSHTMSFLKDLELGQFLPPWMVESMPAAYYHNRLCRMHEKLVGQFTEDVQAAKRFVEVSRQLPSYGLTIFLLKDARGQACRMAVAEDGVFVSPGADSPNLALELFLPYSIWREWHAEPNSIGFSIVVARTTTNRAYTEEEIQSETLVHKFICSASQTETILNLITDYYRIMVQMSERTDEARSARLERVAFEPKRGHSLPNADAFLPFARRKPNNWKFRSRLEVFKHFLVIRFRQNGLHPVVKLWLDLDNALDNNRWLDALDLSATGIDGAVLLVISAALLDTFSYADGSAAGDTSAALIENFPLAHVLLADNAIPATAMPAFDTDLKALLAVHPRIRSIDLSFNANMSNKGVAAMLESLSAASFLVTLSLAHSDVGNKGAFAIFTALGSSQSITNVLLGDNRLTDDRDWPVALRDMLTKCGSLAFMDLASNKIGDPAMDAIVTGLMMSQSMRRLDLTDNKITSKGLKKLATYLHANRGLQVLAVGGNKVSPDVGDDIGRAIELSTSIIELNLANCALNKAGLSPIFAALTARGAASLVTTLNLDGTGIGDGKSADELAAALAANQSITSLSLRDNKLGGKLALAGALATNKSLVTLNLGANSLKHTDVTALSEGLVRNVTLRVLILDSNGFSNHGFEAICNLLQTNRGIVAINADRNKIADKGLVLLTAALGHNTFLHSLSLKENAITVRGFERILDCFRGNSALRELHLEGNSLREATQLSERVTASAIACNIFI